MGRRSQELDTLRHSSALGLPLLVAVTFQTPHVLLFPPDFCYVLLIPSGDKCTEHSDLRKSNATPVIIHSRECKSDEGEE